jgi:hypothetical protein
MSSTSGSLDCTIPANRRIFSALGNLTSLIGLSDNLQTANQSIAQITLLQTPGTIPKIKHKCL